MTATEDLSQQPYIVALTAYSTENFRAKCLTSGMKEFLTKPINEDQVHILLQATGLID
jgi:CheY-like chemotaxis protein